MIPSEQVDDPAAVAVTTGYVGCIERVSHYSVSFYVCMGLELSAVTFNTC